MSGSGVLERRYGAPRTGWRRPAVVAGVVAGLFLGWLAWAAWEQATPQVESELSSFAVVDDAAVEARIRVSLDAGVEARCVVAALADDHQTVGELDFVPREGVNEVVIRTERRATAVRLVGCTGPDQSRPR